MTAPDTHRMLNAIAGHLGAQVRTERERRHLTLRAVAERAGVSPSLVHRIGAGLTCSLESYVRVASALGLRTQFDVLAPNRRSGGRADDPVHAALGEFLAERLAGRVGGLGLDEPYQHYQFSGRADVVAWSADRDALLHIENRTRFPNLQEAFGSYNAKRRYLAAAMTERLDVRGFASVTHVMAGLWSAEVLHATRIHCASFRATSPDGAERLTDWLEGRAVPTGASSSFVLVDPAASTRQRSLVGSPDIDLVRRATAGTPTRSKRCGPSGGPEGLAAPILAAGSSGAGWGLPTTAGHHTRRGRGACPSSIAGRPASIAT